METIVQIIPAEPGYFVVAEISRGFSNRERTTYRYRVVCWALVERDGLQMIIPFILGERGLQQMSSAHEWKIERQA